MSNCIGCARVAVQWTVSMYLKVSCQSRILVKYWLKFWDVMSHDVIRFEGFPISSACKLFVVWGLVCHVDNFAAVLKNPSSLPTIGILKFPKCQFCAASIPKSKRRLQMLEIADFAAEPNWQTYLYLWRGCHGCQELPILQNLIRTANRYDNA